MNEKKEIVALFCPPLSKYPEQPSNISKCELIDCPQCNKKMWLSEKKKEVIDQWVNIREIIMLCYDCFKIFALNNREIFKDHITVDL